MFFRNVKNWVVLHYAVKQHIKCNLVKDVGFEINTSGLENGLYYLVLTSSDITYKPVAFNIIK